MSKNCEVSMECVLFGSDAVDGLSVQRLTLLGRVHVARVMIERLTLSDALIDASSSSVSTTPLKARRKPPRPAAKPDTA